MHLHALTWSNAKYALGTTASLIQSKVAWIGGLFFGFVHNVVFQGDYTALFLILFVTVIDTILGLVKAWRHYNIQSRFLWRVVPKMGVYTLMYVSTLAVDRVLPDQIDLMSGFTAFFIISTEILSIFENAGRLGFETPHAVIKRLRILRKGEMIMHEESDHDKKDEDLSEMTPKNR